MHWKNRKPSVRTRDPFLSNPARRENGSLSQNVCNDFRRTAVRNLERAAVPRSAAMKMVGHKTEAIYRRYAIVVEKMLIEAADKLEQFHALDQQDAGTAK